MPKTIAIIGAGAVGATLARALTAAGRTVTVGVRDPAAEKYADLRAAGLRLATPAEAAGGAEAVLLATPWDATGAAVASLGDLSGKIVLDATNPLAFADGALSLERGFSTSGGEQVAAWAPGASVFKVFNQTGAPNMGRTAAFDPRIVMFVAGDDAARKPEVIQLVEDLGYEAIDAGPLAAARLLEPMAMLWISKALGGMGQDFAFALSRVRNSA